MDFERTAGCLSFPIRTQGCLFFPITNQTKFTFIFRDETSDKERETGKISNFGLGIVNKIRVTWSIINVFSKSEGILDRNTKVNRV